MRLRKRMLSGQSGMTLIEVLAVVVLIGLISMVVVRTVFGKGEAAKAKLNTVKMQQVKSYLANYRLQYNKYPSALQTLVSGPSGQAGDETVFIPIAKDEELKDIWGGTLIYQAENEGRSYVLKSLGADGVAGGSGPDQDVTMRP